MYRLLHSISEPAMLEGCPVLQQSCSQLCQRLCFSSLDRLYMQTVRLALVEKVWDCPACCSWRCGQVHLGKGPAMQV